MEKQQNKTILRIEEIRQRIFTLIDTIQTPKFGALKVVQDFVQESKKLINEKLEEFPSKFALDILTSMEVSENLKKLEHTLSGFIKKGIENITMKIESNEVMLDADKDDSDLIPDKRKKIPYKAVAILKEWLIANVQDPYPTIEDKENLAKLTKLNVKQVHNWFINARGRIWKKMFHQERFSAMVEKLYVQSLKHDA